MHGLHVAYFSFSSWVSFLIFKLYHDCTDIMTSYWLGAPFRTMAKAYTKG